MMLAALEYYTYANVLAKPTEPQITPRNETNTANENNELTTIFLFLFFFSTYLQFWATWRQLVTCIEEIMFQKGRLRS